jgi:integrative and conjugative element protein (TIGR02256 family)
VSITARYSKPWTSLTSGANDVRQDGGRRKYFDILIASAANMKTLAPSRNACVVWLKRSVVEACVREASRTFPMESGGTFMGWWTNTHTAVITAAVGPGPRAVHSADHFEPDQEWQLKMIERHYEKSGRRETYLGDWHSHPRALSPELSTTDKAVLHSIIKTPAARCSQPIMAVLWGSNLMWNVTVWHARTLRRTCALFEKLALHEARVRIWGGVRT